MDTEYEEGYADGIAGAGMQDRFATKLYDPYECGFLDGSLDRKTMIANQGVIEYDNQMEVK